MDSNTHDFFSECVHMTLSTHYWSLEGLAIKQVFVALNNQYLLVTPLSIHYFHIFKHFTLSLSLSLSTLLYFPLFLKNCSNSIPRNGNQNHLKAPEQTENKPTIQKRPDQAQYNEKNLQISLLCCVDGGLVREKKSSKNGSCLRSSSTTPKETLSGYNTEICSDS